MQPVTKFFTATARLHCDTAHAAGDQVLHGDGPAHVSEAHKPERTDDKDADAGSEISAVNGHDEHGDQGYWPGPRGEIWLQPLTACLRRQIGPQKNKQGRAQHQPGHRCDEAAIAGPAQQQRSAQAPENGWNNKHPEPGSPHCVFQLFAGAPDGSRITGCESDRAGSVSNDRRSDQQQQSERDQASPSRERVHGPAHDRSEEEEEDLHGAPARQLWLTQLTRMQGEWRLKSAGKVTCSERLATEAVYVNRALRLRSA